MKKFEFNPHQALELYEKKDYRELTKEFVRFIDFFGEASITNISPSLQSTLEIISTLIFNTLATEDYMIPEEYVIKFVSSATFFGNLAALTSHKTTETYLKAALNQKNNVPKILALYNIRCPISIPLDAIFKANPVLATYWWAILLDQSRAVTSDVQLKLESFLKDEGAHKGYTIENACYSHFDWITHPAFTASYIAPEFEKAVREVVNAELRKVRITKTKAVSYDYKKILVVSHAFRKEHAIYKSIAEYFRSLKGHYHLTYLHLNNNPDDDGSLMDCELFDEIEFFLDKNGKRKEAMKLLEEGDFGVIIYPDVGLSFNTEILANTRLAPIQISTYGHPVSTHSSEIDYFIGGQETETPDTYSNYSERLVLLPGQGNCPIPVEHKNTQMEHLDYLISCSWGYLKLNSYMIDVLRTIKDKAAKPVKFVLTGIHGQHLTHMAIKKDLDNRLGEGSTMLTGSLSRASYMRHIEICRFGIDSYPFGGFNRIIDTLLTNRPVVLLEGQRAYNRMNAAMMRRIGLGELVATSEKQLIDKSLQIIIDESYRQELIEKVKKADIFALDEGEYFRKAIDFLIANHRAFQTFDNRNPIRIKV